MIYDTITSCGQYQGISEALDEALELLKRTDFSALEPGHYEVSDKVYYNVMNSSYGSYQDSQWECHRRYLDIQVFLEGEERIAACPVDSLKDWTAYDEAGDCSLSKEEGSYVVLPMKRGQFGIFFPEDAHRPGWSETGKGQGRKVVIKVLCDE
jgi:YhcH/YjgK/YiaL family protein